MKYFIDDDYVQFDPQKIAISAASRGDIEAIKHVQASEPLELETGFAALGTAVARFSFSRGRSSLVMTMQCATRATRRMQRTYLDRSMPSTSSAPTSSKRRKREDDEDDDDGEDDDDEDDDEDDDADRVVSLDARELLAESASTAVRVTLEAIARRARETDSNFEDVLTSMRAETRRRALDALHTRIRREGGRVVLVRPSTNVHSEEDVDAQRRRADARLDARDAGELAIEQWEPTRVDESTVARFNEWAKFVDDDDVTAFINRAVELFGVVVEGARDGVRQEASFIDAWRAMRRRVERRARDAREEGSNRRRARDKSPLGSPSRMK